MRENYRGLKNKKEYSVKVRLLSLVLALLMLFSVGEVALSNINITRGAELEKASYNVYDNYSFKAFADKYNANVYKGKELTVNITQNFEVWNALIITPTKSAKFIIEGKSKTLTVNGGPSKDTNYSFLFIQSGADVAIRDLYLKSSNGANYQHSPYYRAITNYGNLGYYGGSIFSFSLHGVKMDSHVDSRGAGAAILNLGGYCQISNGAYIYWNTAQTTGGAVCCLAGSVDINGATFWNNFCYVDPNNPITSTLGRGGAIAACRGGRINVYACDFDSNFAYVGGGAIYSGGVNESGTCSAGTVTLYNAKITSNKASGTGGGIHTCNEASQLQVDYRALEIYGNTATSYPFSADAFMENRHQGTYSWSNTALSGRTVSTYDLRVKVGVNVTQIENRAPNAVKSRFLSDDCAITQFSSMQSFPEYGVGFTLTAPTAYQKKVADSKATVNITNNYVGDSNYNKARGGAVYCNGCLVLSSRNTLQVTKYGTKNLRFDQYLGDSACKNKVYTFSITKPGGIGIAYYRVANIDAGGAITSVETELKRPDGEGHFTLKGFQQAIFFNLGDGTYTITELNSQGARVMAEVGNDQYFDKAVTSSNLTDPGNTVSVSKYLSNKAYGYVNFLNDYSNNTVDAQLQLNKSSSDNRTPLKGSYTFKLYDYGISSTTGSYTGNGTPIQTKTFTVSDKTAVNTANLTDKLLFDKITYSSQNFNHGINYACYKIVETQVSDTEFFKTAPDTYAYVRIDKDAKTGIISVVEIGYSTDKVHYYKANPAIPIIEPIKTTSMKITKSVVGTNNKTTNFSIKIYSPAIIEGKTYTVKKNNSTSYVKSYTNTIIITLNGGTDSSAEIKGLLPGQYTITETGTDNYVASYTVSHIESDGKTVSGWESSPSSTAGQSRTFGFPLNVGTSTTIGATINFTNTYQAGNIRIEKEVTKDIGDNNNYYFKLSSNSMITGATYEYEKYNTDGICYYNGKIASGGQLTLKAGEYAMVYDLPCGNDYKVTEVSPSGYNGSMSVTDGSTNVTQTKTGTNNTSVESYPGTVYPKATTEYTLFKATNTPLVGDIEISKRVIGSSDNDNFTFQITGASMSTTLKYSYSVFNGTSTTPSRSGTLGKNGSLYITANQRAVIYNLPIGQYTITEIAKNGYTGSVTSDGTSHQNITGQFEKDLACSDYVSTGGKTTFSFKNDYAKTTATVGAKKYAYTKSGFPEPMTGYKFKFDLYNSDKNFTKGALYDTQEIAGSSATSGTVSFKQLPEFTVDDIGDHYYIITEQKNTNGENGTDGKFSYSTEIIKVTVNVYKTSTGLATKVSYSNGGAFNNYVNAGDLKVSKAVDGLSSPGKEFEFTVSSIPAGTYPVELYSTTTGTKISSYNVNINNGTYYFKLQKNQYVIIKSLPIGRYEVLETNNENFTPTASVNGGAVLTGTARKSLTVIGEVTKNSTAVFAFTNIVAPAVLRIDKTGFDEGEGSFKFEISSTEGKIKPNTSYIAYTERYGEHRFSTTVTSNADGVISVDILGGHTFELTGLEGGSYTVTEVGYSDNRINYGYQCTMTGFGQTVVGDVMGSTSITGYLSYGSIVNVTANNKKTAVGCLVLKKEMEYSSKLYGSPEYEFRITAVYGNNVLDNIDKLIVEAYTSSGSGFKLDSAETAKLNNGNFSIKDGVITVFVPTTTDSKNTFVVIKGLPEASYNVEEIPENYQTSVHLSFKEDDGGEMGWPGRTATVRVKAKYGYDSTSGKVTFPNFEEVSYTSACAYVIATNTISPSFPNISIKKESSIPLKKAFTFGLYAADANGNITNNTAIKTINSTYDGVSKYSSAYISANSSGLRPTTYPQAPSTTVDRYFVFKEITKTGDGYICDNNTILALVKVTYIGNSSAFVGATVTYKYKDNKFDPTADWTSISPTCVNQPEKGQLEIEKKVVGLDSSSEYVFTVSNDAGVLTDSYTYNVYYRSDPNTVVKTGKITEGGTIRLASGQFARIVDVPTGKYTITETETPGVSVLLKVYGTNGALLSTNTFASGAPAKANVTVTASNSAAVVCEFTNCKPDVSPEFVVKKSGNGYPLNDTYEFSVMPITRDGAVIDSKLQYVYTHTPDSPTGPYPTEETYVIKPDNISLTGTGVTFYRITETYATTWTIDKRVFYAAVYTRSDDNVTTTISKVEYYDELPGTSTNSATVEAAEFVNTPIGGLIISKIVTNLPPSWLGDGTEFNFRVTSDVMDKDALVEYYIYDIIDINKPITEENLQNKRYDMHLLGDTFKLRYNQVMFLQDIPIGTYYVTEEGKDEYIGEVTVTDGNNNIITAPKIGIVNGQTTTYGAIKPMYNLSEQSDYNKIDFSNVVQFNFKNTIVSYAGAELYANKNGDGKILDRPFEFKLYSCDRNGENGQYLATAYSKVDVTDSKVFLDRELYKTTGSFYYYIVESPLDPDDNGGWVNDPIMKHYVRVDVTFNDYIFSASTPIYGTSLENGYIPDGTEETPTWVNTHPEGDLVISKTNIDGNMNDSFTFSVDSDVLPDDGSYAYTISSPNGDSTGTFGPNINSGRVTIKGGESLKITGLPVGTYTVEELGEGNSYVASATISDVDGKRVYPSAGAGKNLKLVGKVSDATAADYVGPLAATFSFTNTSIKTNDQLQVIKDGNGSILDREFSFGLYACNVDGVESDTNPVVPIKNSQISQTTSEITFAPIEYTAAGDYYYVIKELPDSETDPESDWVINDVTKVYAHVSVTLDGDKLKATHEYSNTPFNEITVVNNQNTVTDADEALGIVQSSHLTDGINNVFYFQIPGDPVINVQEKLIRKYIKYTRFRGLNEDGMMHEEFYQEEKLEYPFRVAETQTDPMSIVNKKLGSLEISKETIGYEDTSSKAFSFTIEYKGLEENEDLMDFVGTMDPDTLSQYFPNGSFSLVSGETKTFDKLPYGTYTITERACANNIASASISDANGNNFVEGNEIARNISFDVTISEGCNGKAVCKVTNELQSITPEISVIKQAETGTLNDETFTFSLFAVNGETETLLTSQSTLPTTENQIKLDFDLDSEDYKLSYNTTGTFTYRIREEEGTSDNWLYNKDAYIDVTVTVSEEGPGYADAPDEGKHLVVNVEYTLVDDGVTTKDSNTIVNTPVIDDIAHLEIQKLGANEAVLDKVFTFRADPCSPNRETSEEVLPLTAESKAGESSYIVKFPDITFNTVAKVYYVITETTPSGNGWLCDNQKIYACIDTTRVGGEFQSIVTYGTSLEDGILYGTIDGLPKFVNRKTGELVISKTATGNNADKEQFTFTVSSDAMVDGEVYNYYVYNNGSTTPVSEVPGQISKDGEISIYSGQYAKLVEIPEGKYTVTEASSTKYSTNIKVTDGNGSTDVSGPSATGDVKNGSDFTLTFDYENTAVSEDVILQIEKIGVGSTLDQTFSFELKECDNKGNDKTPGFFDTKDSAFNVSNSVVSFKPIHYTETEAGTHYYYIYETTEDSNGWICDNHKIFVEVDVTMNDGKLTSSYKYGTSLSDNGVEGEISGIPQIVNRKVGELKISKTVEDLDSPTDTFKFTVSSDLMTDENGYAYDVYNNDKPTVSVKHDNVTNGKEIELGANQFAIVKNLTIGEYTVTEKHFDKYVSSVIVTNPDGTRTSDASYDGTDLSAVGNVESEGTTLIFDFTNRWTAECEEVLSLKKIASNGATLDRTFEFKLDNYNAENGWSSHLDSKETEVVAGSDYTVSFEPIKYTSDGKFYYCMYEKPDDDDSSWIYDEHKVYVCVTVSKVGKNLISTVEKGTAIDEEGNIIGVVAEDVPEIVNTKTGKLKVSKSVPIGDKTRDFSFTVTSDEMLSDVTYVYDVFDMFTNEVISENNTINKGEPVIISSDQYAIVYNLPVGEYEVSEADTTSYVGSVVVTPADGDAEEPVVGIKDMGVSGSGTVVGDSENPVEFAFTNTQVTSNIVISKTVSNGGSTTAGFSFTVSSDVMTNPDGYAYSIFTNNSKDDPFSAYIANGQSLSLTDNQYAIIYDVPAGKYTVEETTNNRYEASITVTSGDGKVDHYTSNIADATVVENGSATVTFAFNNEYNSNEAKLGLVKSGSGVALDKVFNFELHKYDATKVDDDGGLIYSASSIKEESTEQTVWFESIEYYAEGTYNYYIVETTQDGNGWLCSDERIYATVNVIGSDEGLVTRVTYGTGFAEDGTLNSSTPAPMKIVNRKVGELKISKTVENLDSPTDTFIFTVSSDLMTDENGYVYDVYNNDKPTVSVYHSNVINGGKIELGANQFAIVKDLTIGEYTVTEKHFDKYVSSVIVTYPDGTSTSDTSKDETDLSAAGNVESEGTTLTFDFTNEWTTECEEVFSLKKIADNGATLNRTFEFKLDNYDVEDSSMSSLDSKETEVVAGSDYTVSFEPIKYTSAGKFYYCMYEVPDDDDNSWIYDEHKVYVCVTVTRDGKNLVSTVEKGTAIDENGKITGLITDVPEIVNTKTGKLKVSKSVPIGDKTQEFSFTVTSDKMLSDVTYVYDVFDMFTNEVIHENKPIKKGEPIAISSDQYAIVYNLPVGEYEVSEDGITSYVGSVVVTPADGEAEEPVVGTNGMGVAASGTVVGDSENPVEFEFTNTQVSSNIVISKTVSNGGSTTEGFTFTVRSDVMTNPEGYAYSIFDKNLKDSIHSDHIGNGQSLSLTDNQYVIIYDVPAGTYTVEETITNKYESSITVTSGDGTVETYTSNSADATVVENGSATVTFAFNNDYSSNKARLGLVKSGNGVALDKVFDFELHKYDAMAENGDGGLVYSAHSSVEKVATEQTVWFESIEYDVVGTYYYYIVETTPDGNGWLCSDERIYATVNVSESLEGLDTRVTYGTGFADGGTALNSPTPAPMKIVNNKVADLKIIKSTINGDSGDQFQFVVTSEKMESGVNYLYYIYNTSDDSIVPAEDGKDRHVQKDGVITLTSGQYAIIKELPVGRYLVTENATDNYTPKLTLTLANDASVGTDYSAEKGVALGAYADIDYNESKVVTYSYENTKELETQKALSIVKLGSGAVLNKKFTFTLTECDKDKNIIENGHTDSKTNTEGDVRKEVTFDAVTYTDAHDYYYIIQETTESGNGWICDGKLIYAKLVVTKDGNNLTVSDPVYGTELSDGNISGELTNTFTNVKNGSLTISKKAIGGKGTEEFKFTVTSEMMIGGFKYPCVVYDGDENIAENVVEGSITTVTKDEVFTLKSGQHIVITNLSAGLYEVTESAAEKFKASATVTAADGTSVTTEKGENTALTAKGMVVEDSETNVVFAFENSSTELVDFDFYKTNSKLTDNLEGASFTLYEVAVCTNTDPDHQHHFTLIETENGVDITKYYCATKEIKSDISKADGLVSFDMLTPDREYLLIETKAPEGYKLPKGGWLVSVNADGEPTIVGDSVNKPTAFAKEETDDGRTMVKCTNAPYLINPTTGGIGTIVLIVIGSLLMIAALIFLFIIIIRKKKNGRGN